MNWRIFESEEIQTSNDSKNTTISDMEEKNINNVTYLLDIYARIINKIAKGEHCDFITAIWNIFRWLDQIQSSKWHYKLTHIEEKCLTHPSFNQYITRLHNKNWKIIFKL